MENGIFFAIAAMLGFGAYPVFAKPLIKKYGSIITAFCSHIVALSIILIVLLPVTDIVKPSLFVLMLIIVQGFVGSSAVAMMFVAYKKVKVSLAMPLISTYPFFVLLVSILIFHEKLTLLKLFAALLIIGGAWIIVTDFLGLAKFTKSNCLAAKGCP